jgi:spore coat protein H
MTVPTPVRFARGALAALLVVSAACTAVTRAPVAQPAPAAPAMTATAPVPMVAAPVPVPVLVPPPAAPAPVVPPVVPVAEIVALPPRSTTPVASGQLFEIGKVHQIEVALPRIEWNALQLSTARGGGGRAGEDYLQADGRLIHVGSGFGGYFPWGHADVRLDGEEFRNVGLRYRGNGSFSGSNIATPLRANLKLKLDIFGTKGSWEGIKTFNFNAGTMDYSLTREAMSFALFRAAGVPAPRTAFAEIRFTVPGVYDNTRGGFYVMIENVGKPFLREALPPGDGLLMKPEGLRGGIQSQGFGWSAYEFAFRPDREATPFEQKRVMEFAQLISQPDVALFRAKVGEYLDVEQFLRYLAINAFTENWDSYLGGGHNFYFYLDSKDHKFRFIAWDQDLGMGTRSMGQGITFATPMRGDQPLIYWLLDDPVVQARYRAILKELSETVLSRTELMKLADTVETALGAKGAAPRSYLESRTRALQLQVQAWFPPAPVTLPAP